MILNYFSFETIEQYWIWLNQQSKNIRKQSILRTCECTYIGKQTMLTTCESIYWTSMFIMNHYNSYYWTSMPVLSQFEKLFYVLSHPMGLLFWKNDDLWKFGTCPFSKKMCISLFWKFPKNVSLNFQVTATAAAATVVSQEPSPFGLALGVYHAQGQNIPCGESFLDVTYTMHIIIYANASVTSICLGWGCI